jgi:colanic acid/amylovoran biosynthesis glycosyltransferase
VSADRPAGGIAYVLRKFPVLSETFVLQEILALEARGVPIHVFSLDRPRDPRFHEDLARLKAPVSYVPDVSDPRALLRQRRRAARRHGRRYARALLYVLTRGKPKLLWRFLQACYVANEARKLGLRHLHSHFAAHPTTVALLASMIGDIPYSFTAHAYDIYLTDLDRKVLAEKIRRARFVVTVSDYNKRHLAHLSGRADDKIARVYNGIDLDRFTPNGLAPRSPFTILCVARLVEKKGHAVLVEACRELRDRGVAFRCWIVGRGGLHSKLTALIDRWGLGDHVQLLGPHTQLEVLERYRSAHLYALPCVVGSDGNREGLPVSLVEALACGLPPGSTYPRRQPPQQAPTF